MEENKKKNGRFKTHHFISFSQTHFNIFYEKGLIGSWRSHQQFTKKFVLDTCRRLREKKSYLVWTAVGCLGVPALNDLVKEVDAIQACGGQKTADGRRYKTGGGILWGILKTRDPNAFKEIMKKGKEFEKQFNKRPDLRKVPNPNKQIPSEAEGSHAAEVEPAVQDGDVHIEEKQQPKRPVHERIRVPVSYDDLVELEKPKDEAI